ncbi:MAG TPA: DJ-1/PfpI family protein [Sedimentisphaerales bacterium]|nr:DJ-1/PfpI family protein [Sedimentisphaerales bacterium]HRS11967.1 DJ-1/PfpI family protein [Sedimentisphaerales bacterium]HRV49023.1 DJ-1/PfpI family protein [Sedimentisphaerales bacterium]
MARTALVPIADGTEEIEAACIIDTLRRAGIEVTVASVDALQVTASRGVKIVADRLIADCVGRTYDCIALPGGMPGAEHLRDSAPLIAKLKEQKDAGRLYAAICASPAVVLHHHGLLNGVKATCYPGMQNQLDPKGVRRDRVIVDGNCVTSQGPATAIDFALKLVELLAGPDKARQVAQAMLVAC